MIFKQELPYEIRISPVANGIVVRVGCTTMVYKNKEELLLDIAEYLRDPEAAEKQYQEFQKSRHAVGYGGPEPLNAVAAEPVPMPDDGCVEQCEPGNCR